MASVQVQQSWHPDSSTRAQHCSMQTPASAGVLLNYAHVAQARTLSSMHAPMFGLHAACILQVSHSDWLKWQNHNFFVLCLTRLRRQKKNEPMYAHDSLSADQLAENWPNWVEINPKLDG